MSSLQNFKTSVMTPQSLPPVIRPEIARDPVERWLRRFAWGLAGLGVLLALAVYGIIGCFRLSPETASLRESIQTATGREYHSRLTINLGSWTFGTARLVANFAPVATEPRVALQSLRACEVGIYETLAPVESENSTALLEVADRGMAQRGWERVVGVNMDEQLVAVYMPHQDTTRDESKFAILVCKDRQMIIAAARVNLEPAIQLALAKSDLIPTRKFLVAQ